MKLLKKAIQLYICLFMKLRSAPGGVARVASMFSFVFARIQTSEQFPGGAASHG